MRHNVKELHNLRISVKRLRYSMESFTINYGEKFKELLKVLEDLQEHLGDIHNCDVVETVLTDYLLSTNLKLSAVESCQRQLPVRVLV